MGTQRNEYDAMKEMLELTRKHAPKRGGHHMNSLNEGNIPQLQPQEEEDEKTRFCQAVTPSVQFGSFMPINGGAKWTGVLVNEKINWSFDSTSGVYISGDNVALTDDIVRVVQALKSYFDQWSKYWGEEASR